MAADSPLSVDVATLAHAARTQRMETGSDDLAVGFPFIEGRAPDGTWLRAPLFLYPVTLGQTSRGKLRWTLQPSGPAYLNTTLCETLRRLAKVRLSEADFVARDEDQAFRVDDETWVGIVDTLRASGLELDAGNKLPTAPAALEPRDEAQRNAAPAGRFALRFHLVLGRFPASASTVVNDYEQLLDALAGALDTGASKESLLGPVGHAMLAFEDDVDVSAHETPMAVATAAPTGGLGLRRWQVLPSDASQDEVFGFLETARASGAAGLVVQGPPGTGKSQLITNVLAAMIAKGERVLLVCQKRAALDVVAERLERIGLREPVAVVHDIQQDRSALCESMAASLEEVLATTTPAIGDELTKLEATLGRTEKELARRLTTSQTSYERLVTSVGQPSLVELDERLLSISMAASQSLPDLSPVLDGATLDTLDAGLAEVERLHPMAAPLAPPHPLADRTDWATYDDEALTAVRFRLQAADSALAAWAPHATRPGLRNDVLDAHCALLSEARPLSELAGDTDRRLAHALFLAWHGDVHGQEILSRLRVAHSTLGKVPPELVTRPRAEVDVVLTDLSKIEVLKQRWWRFFLPTYWMLSGLPNRLLKGFATPPKIGGDAVGDLIALTKRALEWQDLLADLPEHPLFHLEGVGDPKHLEKPIAALERGFAVKALEGRVRAALTSHGAPFSDPNGLTSWQGDSPSTFLVAVANEHARAAALDAFDRSLAALRVDFEATPLDDLRREALLAPDDARKRLATLIAAATSMVQCRDLDRVLAPTPAWVNRFLRRYGGDQPRSGARAAVDLGWRTRLIGNDDPHELERPLVDPKLAQTVAAGLAEIRSLASVGAIAQYRRRLVDGARDPQTLKELQRLLSDVQKKRNRPTLRQLYERHGTRLGLVRPIWFCSPESVAALFPLASSLFDLVIFDEASQCPVEAAIPALVRGRTAMIAGDDKQMPPTHFFQAAIDDDTDFDSEDDGGALLAAQSILTLARVALPSTTLSWHYRCRHEELIAFSNAAFYGKKLATAPNAEVRTRMACEGLRWVGVDGRWKEQTNSVEADKVVDLIAEVLSQTMDGKSPPTLGIVAMNRPQAELIERRIEARSASDEAFRAILQKDLERPIIDQLFVRNLENVQGDERDIMILSLGYGPSEKGGRVMARFGPLGLEGGEKRLNVAITRARLGLTVVASCTPEDLAVDNTTHPGPKLLKAFLAFVRSHAAGEHEQARNLLEQARALVGAEASSVGPKKAMPIPGKVLAEVIAKALDQRGLIVQRNLGLGRVSLDLAVRRQDDTVFRVGLDTSGYLVRRDALTRDHHVPVFWQRVGWTLLRVTPGAWRRDSAAVIRQIEGALAAADGATRPRAN